MRRLISGRVVLMAVGCVAALLATSAMAGERAVSIRFAGSGYDTAVDPNQDGFPVQMTYAGMKGSFGAAQLAITAEWMIHPRACPPGYDLPLSVVNSALVVTSPDHSQVFGFSQTAWMCVNTSNGLYFGEMSGIYNGGIGRYEGASGEWAVTFDGATLDPAIGFRSITGSGKGTLTLP